MKKETYNYRKENKLCVWCCDKVTSDKGILCDNCRAKNIKRKKDNREYAIKHRICPRCGYNKVEVGICCGDCLEKASEWREQNRDKVNNSLKTYSKKRYDKLKENGTCTKCGKRKAETNKTMCSICLAVKRKYQDDNYRTDIIRYERPSYGLCYFCGEPVEDGYKVCSTHKKISTSNLPAKRHKNMNWEKDNAIVFKRYAR